MYIIGILVSEDKSTRIFFCRYSAFLEKLELDFGIFFVNGHTKMMIPHFNIKDKTICLWRFNSTAGIYLCRM
jgi:hypothetical protein